MTDPIVVYVYGNTEPQQEWCLTCLLPSMVLLSADMLSPSGYTSGALTQLLCTECGAGGVSHD